jgi:hypothetical protein
LVFWRLRWIFIIIIDKGASARADNHGNRARISCNRHAHHRLDHRSLSGDLDGCVVVSDGNELAEFFA